MTKQNLQSKQSLHEFFRDEYVDQASYDNLRKIASVMDGLKNSSRKVIHTAIEKNITDNQKVSQFSSKAAEFCLSPDTLVQTKEYGLIKIEDLANKGMLNKFTVLAFDETSKEFIYTEALYARYMKTVNELIRIDLGKEIIECTEEHKILTIKGWKEAKDLTLNDSVISVSGAIKILNIKRIQKSTRVYDLEVPEYHNFCVTKDNLVVHNCEYLHGNMDGVVVTLTKDYAGTNNLPLLQKKGNFGTRFTNEASASRYIFVRNKDYLKDLFLKEDSKVIPEQYFEGSKIEPKFFVPTLPLLLINGSNGVSSGFAQQILPRNTKEIKDYLIKTLEGNEPKKFPLPSFNDFEGTVKHGENSKQFLIQGKVKKLSANRVQITEIPVNYDLKGYISVLDKLEEDKKIQDYTDLSNEKFLFEVRIPTKILSSLSEDELLDYLKLSKPVTENYTSMTHLNKIKEYENPKDILHDYIEVKLEYTQKRKDYILENLQEKINILSSRYIFIQAVVNDKLVLNKRKKADIVKDLENLKGLVKIDESFDYLLRMPVSSLTEEELKKLEKDIEDLTKEIKDLGKLTPKEIWLKDIKILKV